MLKKIGLFVPIADQLKITKRLPDAVTKHAFRDIVGNLNGTVLDPSLEYQDGVIPIPSGVRLFIPDRVEEVLREEKKRLWGNETPYDVVNVLKGLHLDNETIDDLVPVCPKGYGIRVPKLTNRVMELVSGVCVVSNIQRAYDILVTKTHMVLAGEDGAKAKVQRGFQRLLNAIEEEIMHKRGLIDNICGARMPFSARAVLAPNPYLDVDQVGMPEAILRSWLRKPEFQAAFNAKKPKDMTGKLVLVGRQPSHDWTNVLAFRIVPMRGSAIRLQPLVVGLLDADHDGDCMWTAALLTKEAYAELHKITPKAAHVLPDIKPKKEFRGEKLVADPLTISEQIRKMIKRKTTGLSLNWHDLVNDGQGTGYLTGSVNPEELAAISNGVTKDQFVGIGENIKGRRLADAVNGYRTIKGGTAKMGGLANSIKQLAITTEWDSIGSERSIDILRDVAVVKHILCQGQLASKHSNALSGEETCRLLQAAFYQFQGNALESEEEVRGFLLDIGVPEKAAQTVTSLYFRHSDGKNINITMAELNPVFMLTRGRSNSHTCGFHLFDRLVGREARGFHDQMLSI